MSWNCQKAPASRVPNAVLTHIGYGPRGHRSSTRYRGISTASKIPKIALAGDAYLLAASHDHNVAEHFRLHPLGDSQVDMGMSVDRTN
jgi:hypothetical protein